MASILVAEDSRTQAVEIQFCLEDAGHTVTVAEDGAIAMKCIAESQPDVVLTDLHMPNLNGLQVTERVREKYPAIPVILMTADGTEDVAAEALLKGAVSYIPKRRLNQDLLPTMDNIVKSLESRRAQKSVVQALVESQEVYEFGNDHEFLHPLVAHFEAELRGLEYSDETGVFRITMALKEALLNAIDHGNLELNSDIRDDDYGKYVALGQERKEQAPFNTRRVKMTATVSPDVVRFVIMDQGPGFDPSKLPDPTDPENLLRAHGRGLLLIRSFMDDVKFNDSGNEITMVKRKASA